MSANSINVARILIQTVHFFYSYLQVRVDVRLPACMDVYVCVACVGTLACVLVCAWVPACLRFGNPLAASL